MPLRTRLFGLVALRLAYAILQATLVGLHDVAITSLLERHIPYSLSNLAATRIGNFHIMATYTQQDLAKAKKWNEVTRNGVFYSWELAGPNGASFVLYRESHHTDEDIRLSERQLRNDRDVVRLTVATADF